MSAGPQAAALKAGALASMTAVQAAAQQTLSIELQTKERGLALELEERRHTLAMRRDAEQTTGLSDPAVRADIYAKATKQLFTAHAMHMPCFL